MLLKDTMIKGRSGSYSFYRKLIEKVAYREQRKSHLLEFALRIILHGYGLWFLRLVVICLMWRVHCGVVLNGLESGIYVGNSLVAQKFREKCWRLRCLIECLLEI